MAGLIDYADLRVDTRERDLRVLALEAEKFGIPLIVVNPVNLPLAKALAEGSRTRVGVTVSYPVGAYWPEDKVREVRDAVEDGADEIYMMMAVGAFLSGWIEDYTLPEMRGLVHAAEGRPTRLITEIAVLDTDQQRMVCDLAASAGIQALVCCSGFRPSKLPPVSPADVQALGGTAGETIEINYMGDVEEAAQALDILRAGASRICTESARRILEGFGGFPGGIRS
jgi:deoxyribose-phosphate aldolase